MFVGILDGHLLLESCMFFFLISWLSDGS